MIKGVAYDLDGTIIESEGLWEEAWISAGKQLGVDITFQAYAAKIRGMAGSDAARAILGDKYGELGEQIVQMKNDYFLQHMGSGKVKIFPGFMGTVAKLESKGIKAWICTSGPRHVIQKVFGLFPELKIFSGRILTKEDYIKGKPDPEPIFLTAKKMGVKPAEMLYVGDAYNDYLAATVAGCRFIHFVGSGDEKKIPSGIKRISDHKEILQAIDS